MNVNKKILLLICLLLLFISNVNADKCRDNLEYGYCVTRNSAESSAGSSSVPYKFIDGTEAICSQYQKIAPIGCNSWTTFSAPVEAGVSYIVNSNLNYICKEKVLTKFLYHNYNTEGRKDYNLEIYPWNETSQCNENSNTVYNNAISQFKLVDAIVNYEITFNEALTFTKSGDNFVASTTVNIPNGMGNNWDCWASGSGSTVSYSGPNYTTVTVTTPVSNAGQNITLTCAGKKQVYNVIWYYYNCEGYNNSAAIVSGQTLVQKSSETKEAYNDNSISSSTPSTTELIINKVNSSGTYIQNAPVVFEVFTDSECSKSFYYNSIDCNTGTGVNEKSNTCRIEVPTNSYYIREKSISKSDSNGIIYVPSGECKAVGPISPGTTKTITYENKTQCELDFEADSSIKNRLYLYQTRYPNFKNLLNFNPEITSRIACSPYYPNYEPEEECLYARKVSNNTSNKFSKLNLSDYNDEIIGVNNSTSYCLTNFELDSSINITNPVTAGKIVYGAGTPLSPITSTLTKTCYIYEDEINNYNIERVEEEIETEELKEKLTKYTSVLTGNVYYSDGISSSKKIDPDDYLIKDNLLYKKPSNNTNRVPNSYYDIYVKFNSFDNNYYDNELESVYNSRLNFYYRNPKKEKIYCTDFIEYKKLNSSETYKFCFQDNLLIYNCLQKINYNLQEFENHWSCSGYSSYEYDSSSTYYFINDENNMIPLFKDDIFYDGVNYYLLENFDATEFISIGNNEYIKKDPSYEFYIGSQSFYDNYMNYDDYITNVNLDDSVLNKTLSHQPVEIEKIGKFYKVTGIINASYSLNPVYAYKLSGKSCTDTTSNKCSIIGYGVASNFVDGSNSVNSSFNFSITNSEKDIFNFNDNNVCEYQAIPEIITYDKVSNGKIELEFRSIDTSNPFPGKSGLTRKTGGNWCDKKGSCSGDATKNQLINDVIINRNNSYNKNKSNNPMYTISLTPSDILNIRDYNKSNPYDDYLVTCDQTGKCENSFLSQYNTIITKN